MADSQKHAPIVTPAQAVQEYKVAASGNSTDADAHFNLGSAYYVAHAYDEARDELEQAVRLNDALYHAHYYLGAIYARAGDLARAQKEWEKVAHEAPNGMLKAQAQGQLTHLSIKG